MGFSYVIKFQGRKSILLWHRKCDCANTNQSNQHCKSCQKKEGKKSQTCLFANSTAFCLTVKLVCVCQYGLRTLCDKVNVGVCQTPSPPPLWRGRSARWRRAAS